MTLQCFVALCIQPAINFLYRIRRWGRLPQRGPSLVISNHVHDLDTLAVVVSLAIDGPQNKPIYAVASRRLFEPGFVAARAPRLAALLRKANWGGLFRRLSLLPIEDDLFARSIASLALAVERRHGDLTFESTFDERTVTELGGAVACQPLSYLRSNRMFVASQRPISLHRLREPYRSEVIAEMRESVAADTMRLEQLLRTGGTLYLTPEGRLSTDGRLGRLRGALDRLRAGAELYVIGISYDVFLGSRLSMQWRLTKPARQDDLALSVKAARPVNVSQVLSAWLAQRTRPFTAAEALAGVNSCLEALPSGAFVVPELLRDPAGLITSALAKITRLDGLTRESNKYRRTRSCVHPKFRAVPDMIGYQAVFFSETVEALQNDATAERQRV